MIRFKTQLSLSTPNLASYSTADNLSSLVRAVLSATSFPVIRMSIGAHYVLPESMSEEWRNLTYIIGINEVGEQVTLGICDYPGKCYGQVIFSRV